jgi:hypothetical protein
VDILFRFFTSFVSCSVFRLSFSSFCCPSVDFDRVASLPGLGLIVFVESGIRGVLERIDGAGKMRGQQQSRTRAGGSFVALWPCAANHP